MMGKFRLLFGFIIFLLLGRIYAQNTSNNNNENIEFQLALNLYESAQYSDALQLFDKIINSSQPTPETTISILFKGKTFLKLKKYDDTEKVLKEFIQVYPGSKYVNESWIVLTKTELLQNNYFQAFEDLLSVIKTTDSKYYLNYAKKNAGKIALNYLKPGQLKIINDSTLNQKLKPILKQSFLLGKCI